MGKNSTSNSFQEEGCFHRFKSNISAIELPKRFTFPFYYTPHPIAIAASQQLQEYLIDKETQEFDFGIDEGDTGIGKMFGVLVVQSKLGELGFLASFSSVLEGSNFHDGFVPPVCNLTKEDGHYLREEKQINELNQAIHLIENGITFNSFKAELDQALNQQKVKLTQFALESKLAKKDRNIKRNQAKNSVSNEEFEKLQLTLSEESAAYNIRLKHLKLELKYTIAGIKAKLLPLEEELTSLKELRKVKSLQLQEYLFDNYIFLNQGGELATIKSLFIKKGGELPPSGAGECAAPKLLQYAFLNNLKPIALAEFWWGKSHTAEIRKHGQYYPACIGKCRPILTHMLAGMVLDDNPLIVNTAEYSQIHIIYEDEDILVIDKPSGLLSVPGRDITDSVQARMSDAYPIAAPHLIIHRLDMDTSGLMVLAKTKHAHAYLQRQFIKKTIAKSYLAMVNGKIEGKSGSIDLPLRLDYDDRPRQMVCYEHGKTAITHWSVVTHFNGKTVLKLNPITGRTHQLRVHCAHPLGLNLPIVGDDLYGTKADRLKLHAAHLSLKHPNTKEIMEFKSDINFESQ